ncbi:uncharacterized protein ACRADG_000544 [Cochliomyia hominivorax]
MCSMSVLCPLCAQTSFSSIDALRCSLIKAANGPLACPICHELFLGLDKLTIHLFSHTNIMNSDNNANATTTTQTKISDTILTSKSDNNENTKNIEKLKTQETKNRNNINSNCNEIKNNINKIKETDIKNEVNFTSNTHHQQQNQQNPINEQNIIIKKPKVAAKLEKKMINKTNSPPQQQQHQQVVGSTSRVLEETRDMENLAQCDICEFTFRNTELRNMHIRLVHQNFEYPSTIATSSSPQSNSSNSSSSDHEFKCHLCSKTFKMKGSLRVHLKVVHLMGLPHVNNIPKLSICDRIRHKENKSSKTTNTSNFHNPPAQPEHLNSTSPPPSHHNNNKNSPPDNSNIFNIPSVNFISNLNSLPVNSNVSVVNLHQPLEFSQNNLDNSTLQTSNVLLVFNTSNSAELQQSLNSLTNNITSTNPPSTAGIPNSTLADKEVSAKVIPTLCSATENPKIWECDVCSKAFTTKYFLKKHKRLHTGEMPYTCELCARTFTFQQSYHKHLLYHSDEKPHVCSTCGRAFKELSTLHNHERIHSGEKPFKCEVCGKSFRQRVSFLVHTRIHTGVMPYKCDICQRSFRYKVSQRTHKCQPLTPEESSPPQLNEENTIDHISENFIKAFLENSTTNTNPSEAHLNQSHNSPASNEIATINEKAATLNEQQAFLTKTIDDIVVESCNKMGIGSEGFTAEQIVNEGSMSPSQRLQNMRLYSPQLMTPELNVIEGDLTRFFLENSQTGNNLL